MLSKTSKSVPSRGLRANADNLLLDVHHFAGNNVSHLLYIFSVPTTPSVQRPDLGLQDLPKEEAVHRLRRANTYADFSPQIELGTACGKLYRCSTMAVLDAGDSDILTGATA